MLRCYTASDFCFFPGKASSSRIPATAHKAPTAKASIQQQAAHQQQQQMAHLQAQEEEEEKGTDRLRGDNDRDSDNTLHTSLTELRERHSGGSVTVVREEIH